MRIDEVKFYNDQFRNTMPSLNDWCPWCGLLSPYVHGDKYRGHSSDCPTVRIEQTGCAGCCCSSYEECYCCCGKAAQEGKMKIDEMPAGKEIDILVAEKVMGRVPCTAWSVYRRGSHEGPVFIKDAESCEHEDCYPSGFPAHYSTNIAATWQVVEHLAESDIYLCIFDQLGYAVDEKTGSATNDCLFRVEFMNAAAHKREDPTEKVWYGVAQAAAAPLAICHAALETVRHRDET